MAQSQFSEMRLLALDREAQAFKLRRDGKNFRDIGRELGINESAAWKAVKRAYKRLEKLSESDAEYQRSLDLSRCDVAIVGLMPGVESGKARSVEALMGVLKRRADLLGLDKPQKIASTTPDGEEPYGGLSDGALLGELTRFAQAIRAREAEASARSSPVSLEPESSA